MRESLHQLTLTLALPISVLSVWAVRGEPAETAALEFATPYRVELAQLPLPARERLRTPGSLTTSQTPRAVPDEAALRAPRPLLPTPPEPAPVDLPAGTDTGFGIAIAPSAPRADYDHAAAVPRTPRPARHGAPALVAAASGIASARETTEARPVALSEAAGGAPSEPTVVSDAGKPVAKEIGPKATGRDLTPASARGRLAPFDRTRGFAKQRERFDGGKGKGYMPLEPASPLEDRAMDLSLDPKSSPPTEPIALLPLAVLETPASPAPVAELEPEIAVRGPIFRWEVPSWSPALVTPEPGSALLLGAALAALGAARRGRGTR